MLSNNGLCLPASAQYVLLFLIIRPVSNFTELHALTLAAHSYVLLFSAMDMTKHDLSIELHDVCACMVPIGIYCM